MIPSKVQVQLKVPLLTFVNKWQRNVHMTCVLSSCIFLRGHAFATSLFKTWNYEFSSDEGRKWVWSRHCRMSLLSRSCMWSRVLSNVESCCSRWLARCSLTSMVTLVLDRCSLMLEEMTTTSKWLGSVMHTALHDFKMNFTKVLRL